MSISWRRKDFRRSDEMTRGDIKREKRRGLRRELLREWGAVLGVIAYTAAVCGVTMFIMMKITGIC